MSSQSHSSGQQLFVVGLWGVRYQVADVTRAFYTEKLGFKLDLQNLPAFGQVSLGGLKLILSGPGASGSRPMPDGRKQDLAGYLVSAISKPLMGSATAWPGVLGGRFLDRLGAGFRSAPCHERLFLITTTESTDRSRFKWSTAPFRFRFVAVVLIENEALSISFPDTSTGTSSAIRLVRRREDTRGHSTAVLPFIGFVSM